MDFCRSSKNLVATALQRDDITGSTLDRVYIRILNRRDNVTDTITISFKNQWATQ